jgi:hypothetical protein
VWTEEVNQMNTRGDVPNSYDDRLRAAYHEAGHALVAHCVGVGVASVCLQPDHSGKTVPASTPDPLQHIQILVGAGIAEDRYCDEAGGKPPGKPDIYAADEWVEALVVARALCDGDTPAAVKLRGEQHQQAVDMVSHWWTEIVAVADALYRDTCLSGPTFYGVIESVAP